MSKVEAMRALREARMTAGPQPTVVRAETAAGATPLPAAARPRRTTATRPVEAATGREACGHRSMNGRTCTRDSGHVEKNHRYG